jgi:hypothetical protein
MNADGRPIDLVARSGGVTLETGPFVAASLM